MGRLSLVVAIAVAAPTLADEPAVPVPAFAAEASVQSVKLQPDDGDGVTWLEVSFRISRCIAGPCTVHSSVKVRVSADRWRGSHGDDYGIIRYEWKDSHGASRTWATALALGEDDQKDRFERESESAVANAGATPNPIAAR
jgi:hypothetical protein